MAMMMAMRPTMGWYSRLVMGVRPLSMMIGTKPANPSNNVSDMASLCVLNHTASPSKVEDLKGNCSKLLQEKEFFCENRQQAEVYQ